MNNSIPRVTTRPTISVVIPTYNRWRFLREALESVRKQSLQPDEIIVIDDGSTDGTEEALGAEASVRYIRQKNSGPSAARNRGMREAKSEWIALLDSDDVWLPGKLEKQVRFLQENSQTDLVFGMQVNVKDGIKDQEPEMLDRRVYRFLRKNATKVPDFFWLLLRNNPVPTSAVMMRRSCLDRVGFFNEQLWRCEDFDLWLRFALQGQIGFINQMLVAKRLQDDNLINDYVKLWTAHFDVLESLPDKNPGLDLRRNRRWRRSVAESIYRLGSFELSHGKVAHAQKWFTKLRCFDLPYFSGEQILGGVKKVMVAIGVGRLAKTAR